MVEPVASGPGRVEENGSRRPATGSDRDERLGPGSAGMGEATRQIVTAWELRTLPPDKGGTPLGVARYTSTGLLIHYVPPSG